MYLCAVKTLAGHISYLLTWHDTVAVPGVGVFYACMESAAGNIDGTMLTAPRRTFRFEQAEGRFGSGCLVESVARERECTLTEASAIVNDMVQDFIRETESLKAVTIEGAGILHASPFGKGYWFESQAINWLEDVQMQALAAKLPAPEKEETPAEEPVPAMPERGRAAFIPAVKYAASWIAAVVGLAAVALIVDFINRPGESPVAAALGFSLNEENNRETVYPVPAAPLMLIFNTPEDGMSIVEPESAEPGTEEAQAETDRATRSSAASASAETGATAITTHHSVTPAVGPYYMIVASLADMREAETFIRTHSADGINMGVLEKDGRIRVYAASGATYQDAVAEAERTGAARRFEQWWVCKR